MTSISYSYKSGTVTVTSDNGTERIWAIQEFEADPKGCVEATGIIADPVPLTIKASQARVALHRAGLLERATTMLESPEANQELKIFWEYEVDLNRDSPALNAIAEALGLSSETVDDLFRMASKIVV